VEMSKEAVLAMATGGVGVEAEISRVDCRHQARGLHLTSPNEADTLRITAVDLGPLAPAGASPEPKS